MVKYEFRYRSKNYLILEKTEVLSDAFVYFGTKKIIF